MDEAVQRPHYHHHRKRVRARFQDHGPEGFADYELLELYLMQVIPRSDVKPLAKRLLEELGSVAGVLGADRARLLRIEGIGPATADSLKLAHALIARAQLDDAKKQPVLSSLDKVIAYCRTEMAHSGREQFRVLFLDRKNKLKKSEVLGEGTVDHAPAYPREIVRRAIELEATAVLLVHNHPSGDPTPSRADIEMTRQIVEAAKTVELTVHDHIVIGRDGHTSMRGQGLM